MNFKKILTLSLSLLMIASLASCGGKGSSSGGGDDPSGGGGDDPHPTTPREILTGALEQDYSNCTVYTASKYKESEDDLDSDIVEYDTCVYYYKGYAIVYDELMAEYGYENPYLFYHDYQGDNLLYFEADYEGGPNAWLKEYENGTQYALKYTCFYLPEFLKELDVQYADFYAGMYYITDEEEVARLNQTVFCGIWENDIQDVVIVLDENNEYISKIYGFEDLDNDKEYVEINVRDIGTTTFNDAKLPEAPNENNVMEYWQYKGWNGPTVNVYPTGLTIEPIDEEVAALDQIPLEIEKLFYVKSIIEWPEVDESRHNVYKNFVTWHSTDESVAKCSYERVDGEWVRTVVAVGAGECEIYAVAEGINEEVSYDTYDHGVSSNHLKVAVGALAELDKTGCKYDLYFDSVTDGTLKYYDWKSGSGVEGSAEAVNASTLGINELYYEGEDELNALILNPNNMQAESSVTFTLDEEISNVKFYYGLYYESHAQNKDIITKVSVATYDGENWHEVDVTTEVKNNISGANLKLLDVNVTSGSEVRITVEANMIGKSFAFATSNIVMF